MYPIRWSLAIIMIAGLACTASAQTPKLDKVKTGWVNVPGGTVYLNQGDAYEHDTGLVRGPDGRRRYPTTPNMRPAVSPAVAPAQPLYQPQYQPTYQPAPVYQPQPYYQPVPVPVYQPTPVYQPQPYYQPYAPNVDYGPYCPSCWGAQPPSRPSYGPRPYGNLPAMDRPKTGDAPSILDKPRG
jgi:hypothetical protein